MSAPLRMMGLLYGGLLANLVSAVAELGVADLLADGPRSADELAERTGADPDALSRVLRALAAAGVFTEVGPRRFELAALGATLRSGVAGSMRDHARNWGRPEYQHTFVDLGHTVRTGRPSFDHVFGTGWWAYLGEHPGTAEAFNRAMANRAANVAAAAVEACDLADARWVVDVGGGRGRLVAALLDRYPALTATVFDLPNVVDGAVEAISAAGHADRADVVGGDFFDSVPAGADTYVLSSVLHDWADADAAKILGSVRRAMAPGARVIVVEVVIGDGPDRLTGALLDVVMMALVGGRERTEAEFAALFADAGLRHLRTVPTASPASVVIGEAVG